MPQCRGRINIVGSAGSSIHILHFSANFFQPSRSRSIARLVLSGAPRSRMDLQLFCRIFAPNEPRRSRQRSEVFAHQTATSSRISFPVAACFGHPDFAFCDGEAIRDHSRRPTGAGDFVIWHDDRRAPASNAAARLNPATGDGIVIWKSNPLLATTVDGEWV